MLLKIVIGLVWLWAIAAVWLPGTPLAGFGLPVLGILVVVHALECLVFLPRLRGAGGSLPNHLFQTFLFGFAHVRTTPALPALPASGA